MKMIDYIAITGPTATGKTKIAVALARRMNGEIISCDSRQVYRRLDLGTGKDILEYGTGSDGVPYHLIDIADACEEYNLFRFQCDFIDAVKDITFRDRYPVVCGGTGMYLDSVVRKYDLHKVPENDALRQKLQTWSLKSLVTRLTSLVPVHNSTDIEDRQRAIRAIEIAEYKNSPSGKAIVNNNAIRQEFLNSTQGKVFLVSPPERAILRKRISLRLKERLSQGMVDEVKELLDTGATYERLFNLGLEYRWISLYIKGEISFDEMFQSLETAIHQFASRQIRWFRRMERKGVDMVHLNSEASVEENLYTILNSSNM